jgi:hypothetical protein
MFCVILAVLLGLNIRQSVDHEGWVPSDRGRLPTAVVYRGFPFACYWEYRIDGEPGPSVCVREGWKVPDFVLPELLKWRLVGNLALGLAIAIGSASVVEWLVRRKPRTAVAVQDQRPAPPPDQKSPPPTPNDP